MAAGSDLGTHGEMAIGDAQRGMRLDDIPVRIGVFVWAVLGLGGWIVASFVSPTGAALPVWATMLIAIFSGIFGVAVSVVLSRSNARKKESALSEIMAIDTAEKQRQLDEFEKATHRKLADDQND